MHQAPRYVVARQGHTDPADSPYVLIAWTREDPSVTTYKVYENTTLIATIGPFTPPNYTEAGYTNAYDDTWDKCYYKRTLPGTVAAGDVLTYTVVPSGGYGDGLPSKAAQVTVVLSPSSGSRCFRASAQAGGNEITRLRNAIAAAEAAAKDPTSPAVVLVDEPVTLATDITDMITMTTDYVTLRGETSASQISSTFPGSTSPCVGVVADFKRLLSVEGTTTTLSGTLAADTVVGQRVITVTSATGISVGDVLFINTGGTYQNTRTLDANGVLMDPTTGRDRRRMNDMVKVTGVAGTSITLEFPLDQEHDAGTPILKLTKGHGNRVERLSFMSSDATATNYQTLISAKWQYGLTIADCISKWPGRSFIETTDSAETSYVGNDLTALQHNVDTNSSCCYAISTYRCSGTYYLGNEFGTEGTRRIKSPMTVQFANRTVAMANEVYGARNYAFNEHGGGSRHGVVAANKFRDCAWVVDTAGVVYGAVFLGHPEWGFCGRWLVNNNLFLDNWFDIVLYQNSYEISALCNVSRGLKATSALALGARHVYAAGWGNNITALSAPRNVHPQNYGSLRLTVAYSHVSAVSSSAGAGGQYPSGIEVGANSFDTVGTTQFPYWGAKDVHIHHNAIATPNSFRVYIRGISGASATDATGRQRSARFQVHHNVGTGTGTYNGISVQSAAGEGIYLGENQGSALNLGDPYPTSYDYQQWRWMPYAQVTSPLSVTPMLAFTDDFNRASLGSDWAVTLNGMTIVDNAAAGTSAFTNAMIWNAPTATGNQYVEATLRTTGSDGVMVRATTDTGSAGDDCFFARALDTALVITSVTNNVGTQLGLTMTTPTRTANDRIKLLCYYDPASDPATPTTVLEVWWDAGNTGTWTLMGTRYSTDHKDNRYVGVRGNGTDGRWDAVAGGDLIQASAPVVRVGETLTADAFGSVVAVGLAADANKTTPDVTWAKVAGGDADLSVRGNVASVDFAEASFADETFTFRATATDADGRTGSADLDVDVAGATHGYVSSAGELVPTRAPRLA